MASEHLSTSPELDHALRTLCEPHRGLVITYLKEERETSLSDLAAYVSARLDGRAETPGQVAIQLHHNHLPRLAELGLLRYSNRTDKRIVLTPTGFGVGDAIDQIPVYA